MDKERSEATDPRSEGDEMVSLIIDDMQVRHEGIGRALSHTKVLHAYNVTEAILQVRDRWLHPEIPQKIDIFFLDHDIESSTDQRDVIEFVRWMIDDPFALRVAKEQNPLFFIHSHNPVGADNMASLLRQAGFRVSIRPFGK